MTNRLRFTRQTRLPEIGEKGQERLSNASVPLASTGYAGEIERRYLEGAGVSISSSSSSSPEPSSSPSPPLGLSNPAAREVAEGALHALRSLRAILESS